jgi:flavin reductase (DIM6/NTAB) family NADH-FMN oxidoreductase RutF
MRYLKNPNKMKKTIGPPSSWFAECVALISAKNGDKENAMPATWAIPVSFNPQLVAVNIAPARFTHDMIRDSGRFGVNLLAEDQVELSRKLGSCSGRDTDKLDGIDIFYGELDVPLIEGCVAAMECEVVDTVTEGDHTVFTGQVKDLYTTNKKPLLLFRGEYFAQGKSLGSY